MDNATAANAMFRRTTDLFIQQKLKKTPLDVGADRIARTAYAALAILGTLRVELGMPFRWRGRRPMFHVLQRSRNIRQPLWLASDPVDWLQKAGAD
jgi:hypothetical protein